MRIITSGLILRETDIGEDDKLVTVLAEDKGIISVIAPGAKKIRNKNIGTLQVLYYCKLTLFKGRKGYVADEIEILEGFEKLKYDIEKFSLAQYFCEVLLVMSPKENESKDFLRLILNSLYFALHDKISISLIKAIFELRTCSISGYMPNLVGCVECKKFVCDKMYFDIKNSRLICDLCLKKVKSSYDLILVTPGVLRAMRHIIYSKFEKLFSFKVSDNSIDLLSNICEKYILKHVDYKFKSLAFINSLRNYTFRARDKNE